jgi:phenylacetate-CoA ligase
MNQFLNPFISAPFIKDLLLNTNRINRMNSIQLERYKDNAFRKMIDYAYTVPLYKNKYKEAGINKNEIRGIKDIEKLPFISRSEIRKNFPDGIIPKNFDKKKGYVICTGGTTGKYCCDSGSEPVCVYTDLPAILKTVVAGVREERYFGLNWRKTRFANIGNYNPYKFDDVFEKSFLSSLTSLFSLNNYLTLHASDKTYEIIVKLDSFKPDIIVSYPAIFQDLSYLIRKGYGKNIRPKLLLAGGQLLDEFTRSYVEDTFGCRLLNIYGSCESGANIAFECPEGGWHIHLDYFHLEAVDKNMNIVSPGERGRLVLTKLWGNGTPLIRYTGMQDWITLGNGKKCKCGLNSPILDRALEGRVISNIILPNGKIYPPSKFLFLTKVLKEKKAYYIRKFQVIQKKIDEIEIQLMLDNDLKKSTDSFDKLSKKIKEVYKKEIGPEVKITVKEVEKIYDDPKSGKPAPLVVTNVNMNGTCKLGNNCK